MGTWVEHVAPADDTILSRQELEDELARLGRELLKAYRKYNPDGDYLAICIIDRKMEAHNRWWREDKVLPLKMEGRYVG